MLALDGPDFLDYVVCPKCDSLYNPEHYKRGGKFVAAACSHKAYSNHPHKRSVWCTVDVIGPNEGHSV